MACSWRSAACSPPTRGAAAHCAGVRVRTKLDHRSAPMFGRAQALPGPTVATPLVSLRAYMK